MEQTSELQHNKLPVLFTHTLPNTHDDYLAAYNDRHDLVAVVDATSQHVLVLRLNGQRAYTIKTEPDEEEVALITALKWKPDGSLLAVCHGEGFCAVYSGETGKLVSRFSAVDTHAMLQWRADLDDVVESREEVLGDQTLTIPGVVAWESNKVDPGQRHGADTSTSAQTLPDSWSLERLDQTMTEGSDAVETGAGIAKLASSLTQIDVTKVLPKLSFLPSHGVRKNDVFTSQAVTNSIFDDHKHEAGVADVLLTCSSSGLIKVRLNEGLEVGSAEVDRMPHYHASHPDVASHVLLCNNEQDEGSTSDSDRAYNFVAFLDLPVETLGGPLLQVIATNTARVQRLTNYIRHTVRCIVHDFSEGQKIPKRFTSMVEEDLAEKEEGDLASNLYHLAMTGQFSPCILEWLTDIIKDTNHKRWDKEMNTMYTNIQDHIFKNLLPALDRLSIAASTLRGHAAFWGETKMFEVPQVDFQNVLEDADSVKLAAKRLQLIIITEHRQFCAFSKWLRVMIEIGIAEPGSKTAMEIEEREAGNVDHGLALAYIKEALSESKLAMCLSLDPRCHRDLTREGFQGCDFMTKLKHAAVLEFFEHNKSTSDVGLRQTDINFISIFPLTVRLSTHVRVLNEAITAWRTQMLPSPLMVSLHDELPLTPNCTMWDIRHFPNSDPAIDSSTYIMTGDDGARRGFNKYFSVSRLDRRTDDKRVINYDYASYRMLSTTLGLLPRNPGARETSHNVIYVQLLSTSPETALCLLQNFDSRDSYVLLRCDLDAYKRFAGAHGSAGSSAGRVPPSQWLTVLHTIFAQEEQFVPASFVLGRREGRTVCILFSKGGAWQVVDLDDELEGVEDMRMTDEEALEETMAVDADEQGT